MEEYSSLYIDFLYYFNVERDYYECHEVLEELWLVEGRDRFYQGLLQVAVGWHHLLNGNRGGARKMWQAALEKLEPILETERMGIDLKRVKQQTKEALSRVQVQEEEAVLEPFVIRIVDPVLEQRVKERADA